MGQKLLLQEWRTNLLPESNRNTPTLFELMPTAGKDIEEQQPQKNTMFESTMHTDYFQFHSENTAPIPQSATGEPVTVVPSANIVGPFAEIDIDILSESSSTWQLIASVRAFSCRPVSINHATVSPLAFFNVIF